MRLTYLAGWNSDKDAIFAALARAFDSHRRLSVIGLGVRSYPETRERVAAALARAKKQPASAVGRAAKAALIRAQYNWARGSFGPGEIAMCWNGLTGSRMAFMAGARDAGAARLFVERAPLPGRITLDPAGVNFEGSLPRDPDWYLSREIRDDWRQIGETLTARASRRADVGQAEGEIDGRFIFCPLQVPDDSQVRLFGGWVDGLDHMIAALGRAAQSLPPGWHLRVKEHPSARQPLGEALAAAGDRVIVDNQTDTFAQVRAAQAVLTLNSSVGLQAFFYDKPVLVLGQALFGIPGLVTLAASEDAMTEAFQDPETLRFDQRLRDAFMTYLDQHYYPKLETTDQGYRIDTDLVRRRVHGLD